MAETKTVDQPQNFTNLANAPCATVRMRAQSGYYTGLKSISLEDLYKLGSFPEEGAGEKAVMADFSEDRNLPA